MLAVALAVSGCATGAARMADARAAQDAQGALDAALSSYETLRTVAADHAYQQGYLRVVMSPEPDAVDFTAVADAAMDDLLDARSRACRQVREAAVQLRLLCEDRAAAAQSYAAAVEAMRGYSADQAATAEFRKLAAALPGDLTAARQARRIERLRVALDRAAAELAALWEQERPTWESYVETVYINQYAAGLLSLRLANFDEKELARQVNDPYRLPVKAGLFKLQRVREAAQSAAKIRTKLRQTSEAFERVAATHPDNRE